jgi:hypothetical protein
VFLIGAERLGDVAELLDDGGDLLFLKALIVPIGLFSA